MPPPITPPPLTPHPFTMQDLQHLLTLAAIATEIVAATFFSIAFPFYVWQRTAPVTAPVAASPTPAATVEPAPPIAVEPATAPTLPTFAADEQITTTPAPNYHAMTLPELKAIGKLHGIKGHQLWKKPATAIAKLEALAV